MARQPKNDVQVFTPDPAAWAAALELADGDGRRIEIRGRFDLVVHNDPLPADKRVNLTER